LESNDKRLTMSFRKQLAYEAFVRTARYDHSISNYLGGCIETGSGDLHKRLPECLTLNLRKYQDLRYGENPHQIAGWYALVSSESCSAPVFSDIGFPPFTQLQGKELSSNNVTDVYALVKILRDIGSPGACIIKHNNPCGVALGKSIHNAFEKAYKTDPVSAFGGVYGLTEPVDASLASRIVESFVEIILAPDFDESALRILAKKKNLRVLRHHALKSSCKAHEVWHMKDLQDFGWLCEQDAEDPVMPAQFRCVTEQAADSSLAGDVAFAWSVVTHLTSNAILVAKDLSSLGFGIGQTSRIASVEIALKQAGVAAKGGVLASDGFFPQVDNIDAAAKAGISVIVQPGGSLKDPGVIAACNQAGIAMLFTGQRCFKH
ncbi:MAG: bifunctional phosphoribosylaminoimidazolecarboxamide formyltransferase/IMP cyclohydrolase, partial [Candidatus Melainabacteria bacterium]|nr:bifunctional phosphoribosylaminoimidazolecarboxamide formyltransferase/IMP cyclohydrolase [Candidatus Melainabacteria bacterium]